MDTQNDVHYDDSNEENQIKPAQSEKLAKLRKERDEARKEAQEYLTGWQRSKADYVNLQKRARESHAEAHKVATRAFAMSMIAVFDSFEAALSGLRDAPESVQKGLTQVIDQFEHALKTHDIVRYTPEKGEVFDPVLHEPMQTLETSDEALDNTIVEVFQSGYTLHDMVVRPARVAVNKLKA
jgi:molecular chaperone GrpE